METQSNTKLHEFGLQVQQLLGSEMNGFDNINNLKCEIKQEFGYCADEKAEEFGYDSFKDMLDSQVMVNYVDIVKEPIGFGTHVQTRYLAKKDINTSAVYKEQLIFQKDRERKEERRRRQAERNFDATTTPSAELFGQTSSNYRGSRQFDVLPPPPQPYRQYSRRPQSPGMEMNGPLDSNWYTNDDDDIGDAVDDGGAHPVANNEGIRAKPKVQQQQNQQTGVSSWSSDEHQAQEEEEVEEERQERSTLREQQPQKKTATKAKFVGISLLPNNEPQLKQQQPLERTVPLKSVKLINLSSDEEEDGNYNNSRTIKNNIADAAPFRTNNGVGSSSSIWQNSEDNNNVGKQQEKPLPMQQQLPATSARSAAKKPAFVGVGGIKWSEDEDDANDGCPAFLLPTKLNIADSGEMSYKMDISGFDSDALNVGLEPNAIVVKGEHKWQTPQGTSFHCSFTHRQTVPGGVQQDNLKCELNDAGKLCVTVTKIMGEREHAIAIPIEIKKIAGKK